MAAAWNLPLVVVCENNLYAVETPISSVMGGGDARKRAEGFGMESVSVDGQNVVEIFLTMKEARQRAVSGGGPTFIEARTYRFEGHGASDREIDPELLDGLEVGRPTYRTDEEVTDWRSSKDPIDLLATALVAKGVITKDDVSRMSSEAEAAVQRAVEFAESSDWPTG